jgi:crotonobetainyl-CoA:carnitine CoA-transferase CaiB-like acyl-CoA transferase
MFATLCKILDRPDIAGDPRFASLKSRQENVDLLAKLLEESFLTRTGREWFDLLSEHGLIVAPIYDVAQCFADPQVQARNMRVNIAHPAGGSVDIVASPMRFSATPIENYSCPPPMGEGTDDVLSAWLGYYEEKIARLRASGAV